MTQSSISLKDFSLSNKASVEDIVQTVRDYGAAVLPSYVSQSILEKLRVEFEEFLVDQDKNYIHRVNYPAGKAVVANLKIKPKKKYVTSTKFFHSKFILKVAKKYIGEPLEINHGMYVTHEFNSDVQIAPTHFDKLWTLKFMVYLNDIGIDQGAFGVIPKSTPIARSHFRKLFEEVSTDCLETNSPIYRKMKNDFTPEEVGPVVDIIAPAGTLIVFDTDTFHHAGNVKEGCERKIMRAHSGPEIVYPKVLKHSRQWWRGEKAFKKNDSSFNMMQI